MTKIGQLGLNLKLVFDHWNQLPDDKKRKKINLILPFIQIASYLNFINKGNGLEQEILSSFNDEYKKLFKQDLSKTSVSDISQDLMRRIEESQLEKKSLGEDEIGSLLQKQQKYIHAHSRCFFNYGNFLEIVTKEDSEKIISELERVKKTESSEEFAKSLIGLNELCGLEKKSALLPKDDLENHALLNQMSNYLQNIAQLPSLLLDEEFLSKVYKSFDADSVKSQIKRDVPDASGLVKTSEELKKRGLEMQVGIETEFLLHSINPESDPKSPYQKIAALKKVVADLNARRKMQTKYGLEPSVAEIKDLIARMPVPDVDGIGPNDDEQSISRKDFLAVVESIEGFLSPVTFAQKQSIRNLVACFTKQEAFFYQMFLTDNLSERCKIDMDGVYNSANSKEENFKIIWPLIEECRFHECLLDMIQAHEVSVGPYDVSEIIEKKSEALRHMKLDANLNDLSLDDPNVQLNMSFWLKGKSILTPEIIVGEGETEMKINALAVEILRLVQEVVAEASKDQGVLRNQQEINSAFDRKKYLSDQLKGSKYFEVDPKDPAFLNHKRLAAKTATIRCSVVDPACKIGVAEIRLIGNNPHLAVFDGDEENIFRSGLEFIPEILLPKIADKINDFTKGKTDQELEDLYNAKVKINHDGTIVGLPNAMVQGEIKRDTMVGDDRENYDQDKPRKSVAIVSRNPISSAQGNSPSLL